MRPYQSAALDVARITTETMHVDEKYRIFKKLFNIGLITMTVPTQILYITYLKSLYYSGLLILTLKLTKTIKSTNQHF